VVQGSGFRVQGLGFTSADKAVLTDLWGAELLLPVWWPAHTPSEEIKCNSLLSYKLQHKKIAQPNASRNNLLVANSPTTLFYFILHPDLLHVEKWRKEDNGSRQSYSHDLESKYSVT
jgi:hypothetical protein